MHNWVWETHVKSLSMLPPFIFIFWLRDVKCQILVPWPGMEPVPPTLRARSLNHWIAREVPLPFTFNTHVLKMSSRGTTMDKNSDKRTCTQFLDKWHFWLWSDPFYSLFFVSFLFPSPLPPTREEGQLWLTQLSQAQPCPILLPFTPIILEVSRTPS